MSSDSEASSMGRLLWDMIKGNYDGLVQTSSPPLTLKSVSASGFALMQCIMALEEIGGQKVQKEIIKEKNRLLNTAADWGDLLRAVGNEMGPKRNMVKLFYKHEHVLQATPEKNNDIARAVGVNSFEPTLQPLNFVSDPTGRYLKYFIDKEYQVKARIPEVVPINTRIRSTARLLVTNGLAVELDWDCPLVPGEGKFSIKPMANEQDTVRVPTLELAKDCVDFQVNPDVSAIYFNGKNVNVEAVVIYVSGDKEHALHMLDYETIEMAMEMGRQGQKARMTLVLPQPKSVEPISLRLVNAKTKLTGEGRLKRVAMNLKSLFRRGRKVRFGRCFSPNKADFCPFETKMNFGMENAFPLYDFFMYTQCHPHLVQEIDRSIKIKFPKIEREEKKVEAKTTQNIRGEAFSGHVFFSGDGKFVIAAEKKAGSDEAVDFNNGLRSMLKNNPSEETSQTVKKMKKPQKVGEMGSNRMATAGDAASPAPVASAVPVANRKVISSTYIMYIVYQSPEGPIILELSLNSLL